MRTALIVGGTGQIGRAAARALAQDGWEVTVLSRSGGLPPGLEELGIRAARADRTAPEGLDAAVGAGVDALVDVVAYTAADAAQLLALAPRVGSLVVISSASVYADEDGRTLDEATSAADFPRLPVPVAETQRTTEPSDANYSTRKVVLEHALVDAGVPATILRPGAIHGPGAAVPRELFFVRRALDGRRQVVLVSRGESRFHTTSVANLAELIRLAAAKPGRRVLNAADPRSLTVREIGEAIGTALGHAFEFVPVDDDGYARPEISNPWAVPHPIVLDMAAAAEELGYEPVATYAEAVRETCAWLVPEAGRDWSSTYIGELFDYAAEDAVIAASA